MYSVKQLILAFVLLLPLISGTGLSAEMVNIPSGEPRNPEAVDDFVPDVTDRVARLSLVRGDVRVRRAGAADWEKAVLNLPLVADDEIATDAGGRAEIQFGIYTHVRIAENSVMKLTTLKDGGIALSVPQGTISLRVSDFDKASSFIEIDAPRTTIAVEQSGMYRVDAGQQGSETVRVTVTRGGEARVYSDNSGFTLRNGRSASLVIAGNYSGEWQTSDAAQFTDEFESWTLDRDEIIAKRQRDAYYDKYYDRDIYGAEELNGNGEWVYTRDYGYVWRPYSSALGNYADWSPYRYGAWRWVPPYGWTWVGDEPWSWATYHYGRWVWDSGGWVWSPYGYYRNRRSWWQPALVVISVESNNVFWYPLPYRRRDHDYNANHGRTRHNGNTAGNTPAPVPSPTPAGPVSGPLLTPEQRRRRVTTPPLQNIPPNGVVSAPISMFGRSRGSFRTPPPAVAAAVISKTSETIDTPPILPTYKELGGRISKEIAVETPPIAIGVERRVRTGAADRMAGSPLDAELRNKRIFGDRAPLPDRPTDAPDAGNGVETPRKIGAVQRRPIIRGGDSGDKPVKPAATDFPRPERRKFEPAPRNETPPYSPPAPKPEPRKYEPPPRPEKPRDEPPPPRYDPPTKSEPRDDPPPKSLPPAPQKSDGPVDRRGKDGRLR